MTMFTTPEGGYRRGRVTWAIIAGIVAFFMLFSLPFSVAKTSAKEIGLSYGGGTFEGQHFQKIVQPSHGLFFNGWYDKVYKYPVTQRNYIISLRRGEGDVGRPDSVAAVTSDSVRVQYEVAAYFKLNTNDARLRAFHENIGLKYHAWTEDGWDKMLNDSLRQQIENALQEESRAVTVSDLYSDQDTLLAVQERVGEVLRDRVAESLGGDYFCGPTFVRGGERCPEFSFIIKRLHVPGSVSRAFEANRTSQIEVLTRQNEIAQATAQAQAIRELNAALAGAGDQYVQLKQIEALLAAIKSGKVNFWVLNGQNLTVPAPATK